MLRRKFLKILTSSITLFATGLLTPIKILAEWNQAAFLQKILTLQLMPISLIKIFMSQTKLR